MAKLAVNGGKALRNVRTDPWPQWPVWGNKEMKKLELALNSGVWSYNGPMEQSFNQAFKKVVNTNYVISAANGTVTLQLALEALDVGYGDEVIVPGLTWQATAAAVVDVNAVPILVDVDPETWCVDPKAVEAAITPRTKAIIPVHLYGCIVDMDAIMKIAKKHKLGVVEDCAHQHGSVWKKKPVGSIGDIGSFSLQLSKVLTGGEGGVLTTDKKELFVKLDALRNCGRRPAMDEGDKGAGSYKSEGDLIQSGNYRMTEWQAAVLIEQTRRLPSQVKTRDRNAIYLNGLLEKIDGITPMKRDKRTSTQSYFNFAFRYDKEAFKGLPVWKFRPALSAELGTVIEPCYFPLNDCPLYRPRTKKRYNINKQHWKAIDPSRFKLPMSENAFKEESVCMHHSVLMGKKSDAGQIADAIKKIQDNVDELL